MKIIDAQVHVWVPESPGQPWPKGGAARAHLPYALDCSKLLAMMDEAGVDGAILVPPSWAGDRNDHALAGAAAHPDRFAVMGRLALDQPGNGAALADWKNQPGMLGIRQTFILEQERERMRDGSADWFWAAAEAADVPVMIHAAGLMDHVKSIAERHPGLQDHHRPSGLSSLMVSQGTRRRVHRRDGVACALFECLREGVRGAGLFTRTLSFSRHGRSHPAYRRCLRPTPLLLGDRPFTRAGQGQLPAMRHSFHGSPHVSERGGQELDHGTAPWPSVSAGRCSRGMQALMLSALARRPCCKVGSLMDFYRRQGPFVFFHLHERRMRCRPLCQA